MSETAPPPSESIVQFPQIAAEIDAMAKVDQDMRTQDLLDDSTWDKSVDANNTARMKEIVAQIGWPSVSRVGEESSNNAWLLVQHADHDIAFQQRCLDLMLQEQGEVKKKNIAMLTDRIRVHSSQPQVYGTQFDQIGGKHVPDPIEDEAHVDERRKRMGLPTLAEGIAEMYEQYGAPDQG